MERWLFPFISRTSELGRFFLATGFRQRAGEDGSFPMLLFRSVFISGADYYVIFDPK